MQTSASLALLRRFFVPRYCPKVLPPLSDDVNHLANHMIASTTLKRVPNLLHLVVEPHDKAFLLQTGVIHSNIQDMTPWRALALKIGDVEEGRRD